MKNLGKKVRFYFRLSSALWQKQKRLIFLSCLIGALTFFYFPKILRFLAISQTQRIGLVGKFTTSELPLEIQHLISQGLTEITPEGQIVPSLASFWETNKDGKEYIFQLKDNIFWQNGKPVVAKDINYNFTDVAITFQDDKKIKFELKEPFAPFPAVVSRPVFKNGLLGTGEYKVKSIKKNGQIVEKLNLVPTKDKSKPKLSFRFYPTEGAARTAFKLGEVDILKEIVRPEDLEGWRRVKITPEVKFNRFVGIFFNTSEENLADKSTRQALAYAIKKRWEPRALSSLNPLSWAFSKEVKPYEFDLENAKKLLKTKNGEEKEPLKEIELSTLASLLPVAEEIKKDWEALGISTKIKLITTLEESFQALLISQEIPDDPDQYIFWHSIQITNITRYKSPKVDKLLEDGRKTQDVDKRKEIYHDFQKALTEDTPAVFLFHPTVYTISRI